MNVAVYSQCNSAKQGGGVLYIMAIASVMGERHRVDVLDPVELDPKEIEQMFPISLKGLRMMKKTEKRPLPIIGEIIHSSLNMKYDMVILQCSEVPAFSHWKKAYLVCEFPFQKEVSFRNRLRLTSFRIIANSGYTASWIRRRWKRDAKILYPPVFPVRPLTKEPWILSVGRFHGFRRSKCQIEMIQMFKELLGSGLKGWTLHLAGTVRAETYLEEAKRQAAGLPVEFHIDASRKELEEIYGRSSIYWHATGAGADPELEPESMEHFGISTGEAMSAGCVPVVINRGGQPEITGSGGAGILWDSFDECIRETLKLAQDQSRLKEMSSSAIERAKLFSFPVFARRTKEIFDYK